LGWIQTLTARGGKVAAFPRMSGHRRRGRGGQRRL